MKRIFTFIFLLGFFPCITHAATPAVKEFTDGNRTKYSTAGHPKSKGINMTLSYPSSWLAREGERPNIVQKFTHHNGRWFEEALIFTKTLALPAGKVLSENELKEFFTPSAMKGMVPEGAIFIAAKPTKIEELPAGILEFSWRQERLGMTIDTRYILYAFIYGTTMVQLICATGTESTTPAALARHMEELKPLFLLMANSIVLQDKWK